tara:strand:- start:171 stop:626 length:456 start_codon:yes stop_codon:yes gene_type:complete
MASNDNINYMNNQKNPIEYNFNNNEIIEINNLINSTSNLIKKADIILLEWFKYDIFNQTSNILKKIDNFTPSIDNILEEIYITIKIYNNIGSKITNNLDAIIYISGTIFIINLFIQIILCYFLIQLYKNNINYNNYISYKNNPNNKNIIRI